MLLIQCVNAYMAAQALSAREMDYRTAYALVRLKRGLKPHFDFFAGEEAKLIEEYADKDENGKTVWLKPGACRISDPSRVEEYAKRLEELGSVEVREEFPPRRASAPQCIQPVHLEALEGFMVFDDGGAAK